MLYVLLLLFVINFDNVYAQTQVCNLGFPPSNTWVNKTFNQNSNQLTYSVQQIEVSGIITITDGVTLYLSACDLHIAPNTKFIVEKGASFILEGNNLFSCDNYMWQGIYVMEKSTIEAHGNNINDGENAIHIQDGAEFIVDYNIFDKCYKALVVENYNGDQQGTFDANTIKCTQTLLPPHANQKTYFGIEINNIVSITSGYQFTIGGLSKNYIRDFEHLAIQIQNSDVKVTNAEINCTYNCSGGIHVTGSSSSADLRDISFDNVSLYQNTTTSLQYALYGLFNFNFEMTDCNFNTLFSGYHSILLSDIYGDVDISSCQFTGNYNYALFIDQNMNTANINNNTFFNKGILGVNITDNVQIKQNTFNYSTLKPFIEINESDDVLIENNTLANNISGTSEAISINNSFDVNISKNTITLFNNTVGSGILVKNSSHDIDIEMNTINKGQVGIVTQSLSNIISIYNNTLNHNMYSIYSTNSQNCTMTDNDLNLGNNGYVGIYFSGGSNYTVFNNTIDFISGLNSATGISTNNMTGTNSIKYNQIDLVAYNTQNPSNFCGIVTDNNPGITLKHNTIDHAGYAIFIKNDNNNSIFGCNNMLNYYHGIQLQSAIWGEAEPGTNPTVFRIGYPNLPYDNYWSQSFGSVKAVGDVYYSILHKYYYKNVNGYTLTSSEHNVIGLITFSTNAGNFCGTPPPPISPMNQQSISAQDNYRQTQFGFAIDSTFSSMGASGSSNNPQGIYNSLIRYYTVENAYNKLKENAAYSILGIASDAKYLAFEQSVGASNIGLTYLIKQAILHKNFSTAKALLQNYTPNNLAEFNTYGSYNKLVQYIETDSLSSADSALLYSIAQQNPAVGGQAVYTARNILKLYINDPIISTGSSAARKTLSNPNNSSVQANYVRAYPNPSSNYYYIDIAGEYSNDLSYNLYSIDGKKVLNGIIINKSRNKLDISELESGVYFIKLFDNRRTVYTGKIIKK